MCVYTALSDMYSGISLIVIQTIRSVVKLQVIHNRNSQAQFEMHEL